jgi:hypothetical protein
MVSHIRTDEHPHVEYQRTALSEIRARTLRCVDGSTLPGRVVVDGLLHRGLRGLTRERRAEQRAELRANVVESMRVVKVPDGLLEEFDALESRWEPPARTGFEPASGPAGAGGA